MSISHFNPDAAAYGFSPCGKHLSLCNWTTNRHGVNCQPCRMSIDHADEIALLHRHLGQLRAELEHFIDIVDGTEKTGFDPHVEQMLMDAAETARALLSKQEGRQ